MVRGDEKSLFLVTYFTPIKSMNEGNILLMPMDAIAQLLSRTCVRACACVSLYKCVNSCVMYVKFKVYSNGIEI